jgi:hypothetical protein
VFSLLLFRLFDTFQAGSLSDFYENCRGLELARNFQFPTLREVRTCTVCLVLTICTGLCCDILWGEILSHHKHFLQLWRIMWRRLHAWSQFENPWLVIGWYYLYKISVYVYSIVGFDILQSIHPNLLVIKNTFFLFLFNYLLSIYAIGIGKSHGCFYFLF